MMRAAWKAAWAREALPAPPSCCTPAPVRQGASSQLPLQGQRVIRSEATTCVRTRTVCVSTREEPIA
jgi:hypothetical protein